jgi:hypothetical protein
MTTAVQEMFVKAKKVKRFVKVALWGDKKSGKTRFALSFPKPCVIDTERGTLLYADRYDFAVKDANRWSELLQALDVLEKGGHDFQTLVIDSLTIFWQDLIDVQIEYVKNRRGNEVLSTGDWGTIKRRWKSFINRLVDINMHVVLVMREKDEYTTETDQRTGEEKSKKTGEHLPDAEKSTGYVFDFILHLMTKENKKLKQSQHLVVVDGSRRDEIPKYAEYDITNKRGYDVIFKPIEANMLSGDDAKPRATPKEAQAVEIAAASQTAEAAASAQPSSPVIPPEASSLPPKQSTAESLGDIMTKFSGPPPDPNQPTATGEDLKVLMTRCGQMVWPDGETFKSTDGKALIKALFKVEGTKELRKPQVDWLYEQFGKVLAGQAHLIRDEKEIPYIRDGAPKVAAPSF